MKAVVLTKPTKAEDIILSEVEVPKVKSGRVLVKIKAFGKHIPHDFLVNSVTLLETGETLPFERTEDGMKIITNGLKSDKPLCFKIEIE